eukprot:jgi/Pico_ML_1/51617/g2612.t1
MEKGEDKDLLFLTIERYKFCVLSYDENNGEITTRAKGDIQDKIGKPADNGQIGIVDPECRMIGLHLYDGTFKVIPIENGELQESYNIRLEELMVIDIVFLHGCEKPTIAVLYQDTKLCRHLKTYKVLLREKEFVEGPWERNNLDEGAGILIPVPAPLGGALVVGEQKILYVNEETSVEKMMEQTVTRAYGQLDTARYLLSDYLGTMSLLVLEVNGNRVSSIKLDPIGNTSAANTLSYLNNGVVFLGSSYGDSQLIQLHSELIPETGGYVEVLESFPNLGPIVDFCCVDLENQGQSQIVTCSGALKDGSLRLVRNGIGINEQAAVDLAGIKGMWSLLDEAMEHDKYLVVSFVGETRMLALNEAEELDETSISGFDAESQSILCSNACHNQLLQVTAKEARLIDAGTGALLCNWGPAQGSHINVAAANSTQIVLGVNGNSLVYVEVGKAVLKEISSTAMEAEISCLDITPCGAEQEKSQIVAAGMWNMKVTLLALPSLSLYCQEALGGEVIPRSVLFAEFEEVVYLLSALGDGQLFSFVLDQGGRCLKDRKKVSLGTQPITLKAFKSSGSVHVFAASDRPTVIYSSNKKLLYSNVNLKEVNFMASFNCKSFPDSLAIASENMLTIGTIDEIQKLHIRTIPLGEQPRRIAHQESSRTFMVITAKFLTDEAGDTNEQYDLVLLSDQGFEVIDRFGLGECESACALVSCSLAESMAEYYVVGTAFSYPHEQEPGKGRILVLMVDNGKLSLVLEAETAGAVYNLNPFNGKLVAGVNSRLNLYSWNEMEQGKFHLKEECSHSGHILVLYVQTRGDFILVGDLMKSITLLIYKPEENAIVELARDNSANWMTAVEILDEDIYLGAENCYNLFCARRNADAATDEERQRLEIVGEFHLGDFVNRFRHGSLVMKLPDTEQAQIPTVIFCTVNGVIGVVASLSEGLFRMLEQLQQCMNQVVKGVGGFSHSDWRSFQNERRSALARGFIDGDLIESFTDLRRDKMEEVVALMGKPFTVEQVLLTVEELQRLH